MPEVEDVTCPAITHPVANLLPPTTLGPCALFSRPSSPPATPSTAPQIHLCNSPAVILTSVPPGASLQLHAPQPCGSLSYSHCQKHPESASLQLTSNSDPQLSSPGPIFGLGSSFFPISSVYWLQIFSPGEVSRLSSFCQIVHCGWRSTAVTALSSDLTHTTPHTKVCLPSYVVPWGYYQLP